MSAIITKEDIDNLRKIIEKREPDAYIGRTNFWYEVEFIVREHGANKAIEVWVRTDITDSKTGCHHYWQLHPNGEWQKDDE